MYPAYEIVQRFYDWYFQRDNIAYWMGAKGEVLTPFGASHTAADLQVFNNLHHFFGLLRIIHINHDTIVTQNPGK